ncbi:MAG: trigger factor [Bacillaceae bacterium]
MAAKWEKLEGNVGVLTVEVDAEVVNSGIDAAFKKVVKKLNVPGFRKGKLPRPMFEKMYGVEALYNDALDIILPKAYSDAIVETGIEPVDRPEVDVKEMEKGQKLVFTAKVTVKPEVTLGDYKGLEIEKMDPTVTDADLDAELAALQEKQAELVVKEDGQVENGDTVVIDFEGFVGEVAFEGGKGENYPLVIGSGSFIPGFEEQLVGAKAGENRDVVVTFPEEYHATDLAGKEATFKVTVHEVKGKELPTLDDEFAKDVNEEVETLDELKAKLREELTTRKANEAEGKLRDDVINKAVENATVDIPEVMVEDEVNRMVKEFENRLSQQGMNLELYFQFTGQTEETLRGQMSADAAVRVKTNLVLEAILKAEGIEVTDADVEAEFNKMSEMYNIPVEQLKGMIQDTEALKHDLGMQKTVELLVANVK